MTNTGKHTEDHCHCGAERRGSDHCFFCGCEEFETVCDEVWEGKCVVCGDEIAAEDWFDEPCESCMNPEMPREVGDYRDSGGNDYGWQDSTFPNEY